MKGAVSMTMQTDLATILREAQQKEAKEFAIYRAIFLVLGQEFNVIQNKIFVDLPPDYIEKFETVAQRMGFQVNPQKTKIMWDKSSTAENSLASVLYQLQNRNNYREIVIYRAIFLSIAKNLNHSISFVPFSFPFKEINYADKDFKEITKLLGLNIVTGCYGTYIDWGKKRTVEDIYRDAR